MEGNSQEDTSNNGQALIALLEVLNSCPVEFDASSAQPASPPPLQATSGEGFRAPPAPSGGPQLQPVGHPPLQLQFTPAVQQQLDLGSSLPKGSLAQLPASSRVQQIGGIVMPPMSPGDATLSQKTPMVPPRASPRTGPATPPQLSPANLSYAVSMLQSLPYTASLRSRGSPNQVVAGIAPSLVGGQDVSAPLSSPAPSSSATYSPTSAYSPPAEQSILPRPWLDQKAQGSTSMVNSTSPVDCNGQSPAALTARITDALSRFASMVRPPEVKRGRGRPRKMRPHDELLEATRTMLRAPGQVDALDTVRKTLQKSIRDGGLLKRPPGRPPKNPVNPVEYLVKVVRKTVDVFKEKQQKGNMAWSPQNSKIGSFSNEGIPLSDASASSDECPSSFSSKPRIYSPPVKSMSTESLDGTQLLREETVDPSYWFVTADTDMLIMQSLQSVDIAEHA